MKFGFGFTLLLLILGGFAAYQGDRVGMIVGKRKLSLFGIRPRYFSRIVSVATGIIIVMITMGGVLLISDTAQKAIFGIEALQSDLARLNAQVNELSELQERLTRENELLRAQNEALHAENAELSAMQMELAAANDELRREQEMLEAILDELEGRFDTLQVSGAWMWEILLQTPLVYKYGDLIGNYVVTVTDDRAQVIAEVERVLAEVNETLWAAGAGDSGTGTGKAYTLERYIPGLIDLSEEEHIAFVVDGLMAVPDLKTAVIQVVANRHTPVGEQVSLVFNLGVNQKVFDAGEVVLQRTFDGSKPGAELFGELWLWLESDVRSAARARGLIEGPDGTVTGELSPATLFSVVEEIRQHGGLVDVFAISATEAWTSDELHLEFRVSKRS